MARDYQGGYGVAGTDFDGAVVTPEYHAITRLHNGHGHAVVGNINGILTRRAVRSTTHGSSKKVLLAATHKLGRGHSSSVILLLKLNIRPGQPRLTEGLPKMLLEICQKKKRGKGWLN